MQVSYLVSGMRGADMQSDRYTQIVLTLILGCLLWLCIANPLLIPASTAHAATPQEVVVVGLKAPDNGNYWGTWSPIFVKVVEAQSGKKMPK
jgi:phosphate/sulfate permease